MRSLSLVKFVEVPQKATGVQCRGAWRQPLLPNKRICTCVCMHVCANALCACLCVCVCTCTCICEWPHPHRTHEEVQTDTKSDVSLPPYLRKDFLFLCIHQAQRPLKSQNSLLSTSNSVVATKEFQRQACLASFIRVLGIWTKVLTCMWQGVTIGATPQAFYTAKKHEPQWAQDEAQKDTDSAQLSRPTGMGGITGSPSEENEPGKNEVNREK